MFTRTTGFRRAAFGLTTAIALLAGCATSASAQSATPVNQPGVTAPLPKLEKLTVTQCQYMADRVNEMIPSFERDHFSTEFKRSIGRFTTRAFDCSGPPILTVMKPEDDRGVVIVWKFMFDNKQGNLYDSVYIHDPNGVAEVSKKFRPNQVLRVLPPGLAASNAPTPAPGG